ncbi:hypothetical protein [Micromonospora sp. CB01531]|uniref:hypothetical protein n=1 Tax=Micromonospora sp. CB01531 TaxID=1718947 RepID=UPI00093B66F1|nr:hypothetical protein [Micromonospora sp. CB01531]OKI62413.1 hypothetical protein A6A27_05405 [Micromonospora sp. CB01531]
MRPEPGDLLRIDGRASVQFAGGCALTFRVVSVCDRPTYAGWVWLTGYVINRRGNATAKREIYVQLAGLRRATAPLDGSPAPRCIRFPNRLPRCPCSPAQAR